jgi:hypothetical protein
VRFNKRQALYGLLIAGLTGAVLVPPALYYIGLALAPPRPVPATTHAPPLLAAAIWARADGGHAAALIPVTPVSAARFAACVAIEDFRDTTPGDARRVTACRAHLPAIQGVEYLSTVHMRDASLKPSFREGIARFSTSVWLTHTWTKTQLLDALTERGEFGFGFRGAEAAAQGYFGRAANQLTLSQAATIGAFIGNGRIDPWCDPAAAAAMRRRILERMRDDAVIDEAGYQSANATELGLIPPPPHHKPCGA